MLNKQFTISYAPNEELGISKLVEQFYEEHFKEIDDIEENAVSFRTMYIFDNEDKIEVKIFIINSTECNINFGFLEIYLVNFNNEIITSENIKLEELGEIPPMNARPFSLFFSKSNIAEGKAINENCKIIIKDKGILIKQAIRPSIEYIDEKISLYEQKDIIRYIETIPPVEKGEVKLLHYKSSIDELGDRYSILAIINGSDISIKLKEFSILYKDQFGITQAVKKVNSLSEVKSKAIAINKITINDEDIIKPSFDVENCKVIITST